MRNELQTIAMKYGTDKAFFSPDQCHWGEEDNAISAYHGMFHDRRQSVNKVLEIGIGTPSTIGQALKDWKDRYGVDVNYTVGGSLRTWEEYFPNAQIFALDIVSQSLINRGRIYSFLCDQSNRESLKAILPQIGDGFDLIIDDGSHNEDHQLLTLEVFLPLRAANGVYVIEDIENPESMKRRLNELGYTYEHKEFRIRSGYPAGNWMIFR